MEGNGGGKGWRETVEWGPNEITKNGYRTADRSRSAEFSAPPKGIHAQSEIFPALGSSN